MAGMQITASNSAFAEGPGCADVVVRDNTFVGCNYGSSEIFQAGTNMACVNVTASVRTGLTPAPLHRRLTLDANVVVDTPGLAYLLASCDGVTFTNNTSERSNTVAWSELRSGEAIYAKASGSIMVTRASNVTMTGNRELVFSGTTDRGIYVDAESTSAIRQENNTQGWIVPSIGGASLDGRKTLTIVGSDFDGALRVLVNGTDVTKAIASRAPTALVLKGDAKRLGLKPGENTLVVVNPLETRSNPYRLGL
jgi:hypothetical protein